MAGETFLPDLVTRLRLDTTEMQAGVGKAAALGGAIGGAVGGLAAAGLQKAAEAVTTFVSGSVASFSQLEDSTAAAGVIFGDSMGRIIEQSRTAASTIGLSSQQVISAANTFGTYGKSAGLASDANAEFSMQMTDLAGSLASFKGTSPEQAIEAIGSALRGEAEPIRAYGVLLDDATLKARALALGIADGTSALTPQQKVLAAQAEILAQTTDAQGDYARTMNSTANVSNRFANVAADVQAKVGGLLAPSFTAAKLRGIDMLTSLSAGIDVWAPKIEAFRERTTAAVDGVREVFATGDITSGLLSGLGVEEDSPIVGVLLTLRDVAEQVGAAVGPALAQIAGVVGSVFETVAAQVGPLAPQLLDLALAFSPLQVALGALAPLLPTIAGLIGSVVGTLATTLAAILPPLITVGQTISTALVGALVTLAPVVAEVAGVLAGTLGTAIASLAPVIVSLVPIVGQIAAVLAGVLGTVVQALAPLLVMLAGVVAALLPPILGLIAPLLSVVEAVLPLLGVLGQLIGAVLPPLIALFMAVIGPVLELVGVIAGALTPVITLLASILTNVTIPILSAMIGVVANVAGGILSLAGPVLGGLVGMIGTVIGWVARVIGSFASWVSALGGAGAAVGRMASSVGEGVSRVVSLFSSLPAYVVSSLGNLGSRLYSAGGDLLQGMIDGVKAKVGRVVEAVKGAVGDAISGAKRLLGISSPSKVFAAIGDDTMAGMEQGIERSTRGVVRQAERMAGAVAGVQVRPPELIASTPAGNYRGGRLATQGAPQAVQVRVFLGNEELTDRMRVEVFNVLDEEAQAMSMGTTA